MTNWSWSVSKVAAADLPAIKYIEDQSPSPWNQNQLEGELFVEKGLHLVCRPEGSDQVVGFILARHLDDEAEIIKLATDNAFQRKGAGSRLLTECIQLLRSEGVKRIYLEFRSRNRAARQLYEKYDFVMTGLRKSYYTDPQDDAVCMSLLL